MCVSVTHQLSPMNMYIRTGGEEDRRTMRTFRIAVTAFMISAVLILAVSLLNGYLYLNNNVFNPDSKFGCWKTWLFFVAAAGLLLSIPVIGFCFIRLLRIAGTRDAEHNELLHQGKELYHSMVDAIEEYAVLYLDKEGIIRSWNKGAERIYCYSPEEAVGKHFSLFYTQEQLEENRPLKILQNATELNRTSDEGWRMRKDGSVFWASVFVTALRDSSGAVTGFSKVTRDMTEKKSAEETLNRFNEERMLHQRAILKATVDGQERERNEIGMELHDNINQMLAAVKLYISAAINNSREGDEFLKQSMKITEDCIDEIRRLSANLVSPEKQRKDLKDSITDLVEQLERASQLTFHLDFEDALLGEMKEESTLAFYRIIQEQLNNILKHSMAENVSITIGVNDDKYILIIEDDGIGFDLKNSRDGLGMGNMQTRVELLKGELEVRSEPGKGCAVIVKLPLKIK